MGNWWKFWSPGQTINSMHYLVVEVEKPRKPQDLDDEMRNSVISLQTHPGFMYLLSKLKYQGALLKQTLQTERQANMVDVEFLKSGIAWCDWLQNQLESAAKLKATVPLQEAEAEERRAFDEIRSYIKGVGSE